MKVVFTLQNKGSYNGDTGKVIDMNVVFTLQNKGSYNYCNDIETFAQVVFTLQNKGSYNSSLNLLDDKQLFLPFKIKAVTTY